MKALGCNAAAAKDWTGSAPFIDLVKSSRPWVDGSYAAVGLGTATITLTNGYPSSITGGDTCRMVVSTDRDPSQALPTTRYAFTWTGTMTWSMSGTHSNTSLVGNRFEFDWDGDSLRIDITAVSATIGAFRVFQTSEEALLDSGEIFSPRWIEMREPFGIIRFLNWNEPNSNTGARQHEVPADMVLEASAVTWQPVVPFSVMAKAAAKVGQLGWYCLPLLADDDYMLAAAQEIYDNTPDDVDVYVELCNELWNFSFLTQADAQAAGVALGYADEYASTFKFQSHRSQEVFDIFAGVFGQHRVRAVIAGQAAGASTTGAVALDWEACASYPNLAYAIAPYVGGAITAISITGYNNGTGAFTTSAAHGFSENDLVKLTVASGGGTLPSAFAENTNYYVHVLTSTTFSLDDVNPFVGAITGGTAGTTPFYTGPIALWINYTTDQAMDEIEAELTDSISYMDDSYAMCKTSRNVRMIAYEGGPHQIGSGAAETSTAITTLLTNANASVRMGALMTDMLDEWLAAGGQEFVYYADCVLPSRFGCWGALEYQEQTFSAAEKYTALADWSALHNADWENPMAWVFTNGAITAILDGTLKSGDTYKMALVTSASNISATTAAWADVTNEVAEANGYVQGGESISLTLSGTDPVKVDIVSDPRWDASGGTIVCRWAVIYEVSGLVLCYALLDATPADVTIPDGQYLIVSPPADGVYSVGT